jgi:hypothetical protein
MLAKELADRQNPPIRSDFGDNSEEDGEVNRMTIR